MSLYKMGISDKTMGAARDSDPEVQKMIFDAQQNNNQIQSQPVEDDPNFFQRLLNFVNPFTAAGAAEPDINVITGLPVNTNTGSSPFVNISQFEGRVPADVIKENIIKNFNLSNQGTDFGNTQSGFATNFPLQPVPVNTGITQSTVGQTFEPPFVMAGGQKFALGDPRIAEQRNVFKEPQGILSQAKDFITQRLPQTLKGGIDTLINFIPGMRFIRGLDKFNTLPYMDRKFIESRMKGNIPGISVDPRSGLLKDAAGLNVRSLMGNYAERIEDEYKRYSDAIKRAKETYGVGFDGTSFTGANADIANKMNNRNINMFNFFKDQKAAKDKQIADLRAKMKKQVEAGETAKIGQSLHGGGKGPDGGGQNRFDGARSRAQYDKEPTAYSGSF